MKRAVILSCVVFALGCAKRDSESLFDIPADLAGEDRQFVQAALAEFHGRCAALARARTDVEEARLFLQRPVMGGLPSPADRYGWTRAVELEVAIKDRPDSRELWDIRAQGQRCSYVVGSGRSPGLFAVKRSCKAACGLDPLGDGFVALPALR